MRFAWIVALCLVATAPLTARPYSVSDMLSLESYGRALFSPAGDVVVVERIRGQDGAARYAYDYFENRARTRIMVAAVHGNGGLRPLFPQDPLAGYWIAGFSPSGTRLAIYRLRGDRISLGVVEIRSRRVRWLPVTPDLPAGNVNPTWLDEQRLMLVALPHGTLPLPLDFGGRAQRRLPRLWAATARGRVAARTVVGSGTDLQAGVRSTVRGLVVVDIVKSVVRRLAVGDIVDFSLSPDRRNVALVERGATVAAPRLPRPLSLDFQSRRLRLRIVAIDGRSASPCPGCDLAPDLLAWSASGARLLVYSRAGDEPWEGGGLGVVDMASRHHEKLVPIGMTPSVVRTTPGRATVGAGWLGERPIAYGRQRDGAAGWFDIAGPTAFPLTDGAPFEMPSAIHTDGTSICGAGGGAIWTASRSKPPRLVEGTRGASTVNDSGGTYDVGTRVVFEPVRAGKILVRRRTAGGDELVSAACDGTASLPFAKVGPGTVVVASSPISGSALITELSERGATELVVVGVGARTLDLLNGQFASVDRPRAVAIRREVSGQHVTDWLLLPPGATFGRPLPLMVVPYPGTVYGDKPPADFGIADFEPALSPPLLAANGYAVLAPSMPIGPGEPVDDIIQAVRPAIGAAIGTGRIDPSRVGVLGHSYGGYTALLMATELPCLRSVVASASISDLSMMYGSFDPRVKGDFAEGLPTTYPFAWAEDGQGRMGVPPWKDPGLYVRNSPFYRLDRVRTPILLLHGDLDPLSISQAERTFGALYRLNKDVRLLSYYGEGHVPASPATIRDRWTETFSWLSRTMASRQEDETGSFDTKGSCSRSRPGPEPAFQREISHQDPVVGSLQK